MNQQVKRYQLAVRMTDCDRAILLKLAEIEERNLSDIMRRLLRQEAVSRGLDVRDTAQVPRQVHRAPEPCAAQPGAA